MRIVLRPSRRFLVILSICLLLGAIINVAVAWGCTCWSPFEGSTLMHDAGWAAPVPADWPEEEKVEVSSWRGAFGLTIFSCWGIDDSLSRRQWVLRAGWPRRSLFCERHGVVLPEDTMNYWLGFDESTRWSEGLNIPDWLRPRDDILDKRVLPTQLLWTGFLANTLFYAFILWCIGPGLCLWRRRRRIKRNRCVKCGYDLRGADHVVCPECGTRC